MTSSSSNNSFEIPSTAASITSSSSDEMTSNDGYGSERSVLIERDTVGRPTGYACSHAVPTKDAWDEFYRKRVQISQYYEVLYDCDVDNVQVDGESIAAILLQDIAAAWDLIPSGLACLEQEDEVLHGISTGETVLIHQVGCQLLPAYREASVSSSLLPQCCQIIRLDLNVLPSNRLPSSTDALQTSIRSFVQQTLHHRTFVQQELNNRTPVRTLAIPDPLGASSIHMVKKEQKGKTGLILGDRGLTILGGALLSILMASVLSICLFIAYRRRRRRKRHYQHTRMKDPHKSWDKEETTEQEGDSTLDHDSSDSSVKHETGMPDGLYRDATPLPRVATMQEQRPPHRCMIDPALWYSTLTLSESLRDGFFCHSHHSRSHWDLDEISEADSWAQTDATVGSLEERLDQITAEI